MFIRLTFFDFQLQYLNEVKKIFNDEVVPVVKTQKGNLGIWLLEPTSPMEQFISLTEWTSEEDAEAYHTSGTYKKLVDMVKDSFESQPVLKSYTAEEESVHA